jgi:predicted dehydrogenase
MKSVTDLGIGVIGVGGRGSLADFAHLPGSGAKIVAGADASESPLRAFRHRYGENTFITDDYRKLLQRTDVDAVFVTTPDFCHEEHAIAALRAGKAVYLEKPMAISIEGCDRILLAAMQCGSRLFVGHNMRHMFFVRKMKEMIDNGAIGEVKTAWCRHFISYGGDAYFKDWHAERVYSNSLLLQKAAHDLDVLHWLCGGYAQRVHAMGALSLYGSISDRNPRTRAEDFGFNADHWPPLSQKCINRIVDVEDISMLNMRLDNGVLCSYQQCHFTPDACRNFTIIGSAGRIENIGDGPGECIIKIWNQRHDSYRAQADIEIPWPIEKAFTATHGGADPSIVAEFLRFVREGGATTTSPIAARYSVAAGCAAAASLRQGGIPLDVHPLGEEMLRYFALQP